jgi:DUF4097 and DUF4098 domain-containing protein YvlB
MNYEYASPGPISADLRIAAGSLHVDAGEHDKVSVLVEPWDNSNASKDAAEQTRVSLDGKHLSVQTPKISGWKLFTWPKLRITVRVPAESTLTVKSAAADVTCNGVYKDVVAHTASGDLQIDRVIQDASTNSASGDVRLGWVGGDVRVHSASGDIAAQHVGKDFDATTASGDIELNRAEGGVRAKTASGDVKVGLVHRGDLRIHTASGDVAIGFAAGTGVWLDLATASGRTTSDLATGDGAPPATGTSLNVKVRTASGDITLRRVVTATAES